MTFGEALENLKKSQLVQRTSWAAQGRHVYLEDSFGALLGVGGGLQHQRKYRAVFIMYEHDKIHHPGWVPTPEDMLANDWQLTMGNYPALPQSDNSDVILVEDADKPLDVKLFLDSVSIKGYASFRQFVQAWFTPDRLDCLVPLNTYIWAVQRLSPTTTARQAKGALKSWCVAQGYQLNPLLLRGKDGRIMRRRETFSYQEGAKGQAGQWVGDGALRTQEFIYVQTQPIVSMSYRYWNETPNPEA